MTQVPENRRLPLLVAVAAAVALMAVALVVVLPALVSGPRPTPSASGSGTPSATPDASTPEGATRAFFKAYADARRSGDPNPIRSLVTSDTSSAYLTVDGFLRGQTDAGKASITTVLEMNNVGVEVQGDRATLTMDLTEGGYDIDLDSGEPLESPTVLPTRKVTVQLRNSGGTWLVESFESAQ